MGHLTTSISSDGVNSSHVVVHVFFGNQVYRRLRRDLLSHFVILIGTRTHLDQYWVTLTGDSLLFQATLEASFPSLSA